MQKSLKEFFENESYGDALILDIKTLPFVKEIIECDKKIKFFQKQKNMFTELIQNEMGEKTRAEVGNYNISWSYINYKAQPEKIIPAKPAYKVRKKSLVIKNK